MRRGRGGILVPTHDGEAVMDGGPGAEASSFPPMTMKLSWMGHPDIWGTQGYRRSGFLCGLEFELEGVLGEELDRVEADGLRAVDPGFEAGLEEDGRVVAQGIDGELQRVVVLL